MIRYSHVSLSFVCDSAAGANEITAHLGVQPSRIKDSKSQSWSKDEGRREKISWSWMLDSPKSHAEADVPERLWALAEVIEPFAERLMTVKSSRPPWVDVLYHNTPQNPHGITGEFHWFRMPVDIMRRFSGWNLDISCEVIWFDHPEWVRPKTPGRLGRLAQRLQRLWSNKPGPGYAGKVSKDVS